MKILQLEKNLIRLIAVISNIEATPMNSWNTDLTNNFDILCNRYSDMLDTYANYCDAHPTFNNKVNY